MTTHSDVSHRSRVAEDSAVGSDGPPPVEVYGWASDNHRLDDAPAVIVNPKATALTLLSWGLGQVQQCNVLLDALSRGDGSQEYDIRVTAGMLHFLKQAETVLSRGVEKSRGAEGAHL